MSECHHKGNEDHTANCYLGHLHSYDDELLDHVASLAEWSQFKVAVQRWVADIDAEYDRLAQDQEHGRDGF